MNFDELINLEEAYELLDQLYEIRCDNPSLSCEKCDFLLRVQNRIVEQYEKLKGML